MAKRVARSKTGSPTKKSSPRSKPATKKVAKPRGKAAPKAKAAPRAKPQAASVPAGIEPTTASSANQPSSPHSSAREFAVGVARLCHDDHCEDVVVMDVHELSSVTAYVVIASGTSDRQMRSVLKHVEELGATTGNRAYKTSADDRATWLIADFVHVMVHLFEPHTRSHYDLEMLWGDAPRLSWERPDQQDRDRAGLAKRPTRAGTSA